MDIKASGKLEFRDYVASFKLARKWSRLLIRIAVIIYGLYLVITGFAYGKDDQIVALIGALLASYGLIVSPLILRFQLKRNWNKYPALNDASVDIAFSDEGMMSPDEDGGPVLTRWNSFTGWREGRGLFLLYASRSLYLIVPKRFMSKEESEELGAFLSLKIGKTK